MQGTMSHHNHKRAILCGTLKNRGACCSAANVSYLQNPKGFLRSLTQNMLFRHCNGFEVAAEKGGGRD